MMSQVRVLSRPLRNPQRWGFLVFSAVLVAVQTLPVFIRAGAFCNLLRPIARFESVRPGHLPFHSHRQDEFINTIGNFHLTGGDHVGINVQRDRRPGMSQIPGYGDHRDDKEILPGSQRALILLVFQSLDFD